MAVNVVVPINIFRLVNDDVPVLAALKYTVVIVPIGTAGIKSDGIYRYCTLSAIVLPNGKTLLAPEADLTYVCANN